MFNKLRFKELRSDSDLTEWTIDYSYHDKKSAEFRVMSAESGAKLDEL